MSVKHINPYKNEKHGKFLIPASLQFCYPEYRNKNMTLRELMELAEKRKVPKRDPRYIVPYKPKTGNT